MAIYNPKSLKAEEFINDEEIRETIRYAEENKHNVALIDAILEKARPQKTPNGTTCAGLTHREASVLLACDIPEKVEEMYRLAAEIKTAFYGNRIVLLHRCTSPTTASTAASTVHTTRKTSTSPAKSSLRKK